MELCEACGFWVLLTFPIFYEKRNATGEPFRYVRGKKDYVIHVCKDCLDECEKESK